MIFSALDGGDRITNLNLRFVSLQWSGKTSRLLTQKCSLSSARHSREAGTQKTVTLMG